MKRALCLLMVFLTFLAVLGCERYEQNTVPFTAADVSSVLQGFETVDDYVKAVKPTNFEWFYIGDTTRETQLTISNPDGRVMLRFVAKDGKIGGNAEGQAMELHSDILALKASVVGIEWLTADFAGIPTVRGLRIKDSRKKVQSAFLYKGPGDVLYTIADLNANADKSWIADWAFVGGRFLYKGQEGGFNDYDVLEYGYCVLESKQAWKLYYNLLFDLEGGKVRSIRLYIEGDER